MPKYRALTGIEYNNRRLEAGDLADDIPAKSIKWLREQGLIEQVDGKGAPVEETPVEETPAPAPAAEDEETE